MSAPGRPPAPGPARGFTLVEVLVALAAMAIMAALAWRGIDGMLRARDVTQASLERTTRLNTVIVQWEQDLQSIADTGGTVPALSFDGQTLRLTRLVSDPVAGTDAGVQMVAWALRGGVWTRWAGPPVTRSAALQEQWMASQQLLGNEREQVRLLDGIDEWQVYFYRDGRRTNPQSTGDSARSDAPSTGAANRELPPDGVQLVLKLPAGTLTRDVIVMRRS